MCLVTREGLGQWDEAGLFIVAPERAGRRQCWVVEAGGCSGQSDMANGEKDKLQGVCIGQLVRSFCQV